mmetsp:Transcript_12914/g.24256  ORF Transcript_12914/g.24256 Transcript_12914/m.24256 type:complete len:644 (+) Transcript_12914:194-2125(+)|eukprot:CAMPEP_0176488428 /NCGR_PEP_ID=MMETSP0200_2-20121128/6703_1 /TAXON_ID=947934 /ORGANISM="Chaetoceros sp., Strain GSL56" /LENGTH=643 /DNA_ID=CAMNT_0017885409 /DNA_START=137 /DNA_END=2068 /DNA_ORIENTATION=-
MNRLVQFYFLTACLLQLAEILFLSKETVSSWSATASSSHIIDATKQYYPTMSTKRTKSIGFEINSHRSRDLKSSKKKKSKKSKKTTAPTTSPRPSSAPSPSPSMTPTMSSRPSTVPSTSPTSKPSSSPTSQPSDFPSVSSQPSLNPTSKPSAIPSLPPSSNPTKSPSQSPSSEPSISNAPSSIPSTMPSSFPSVNVISGTKNIDGGIQQGCPVPPNMDESNFAEESVKRVPISFVYSIRFRNSANEKKVLSDIENDFQDFVFNEYINCDLQPINRHNRQLIETASFQHLEQHQQDIARQNQEMDGPIGASSAPMDERATDMLCAKNDNDNQEICRVMDGKFVLIFADIADISESEQELLVLTAIMNAIKDGSFKPSNSDTTVLEYIGKRDGGFLSQAGIIPSITETDTSIQGSDRSGVSVMGGVIMGASFFIITLALFAGYHRKRIAHFERVNQGALTRLTSLRHSSGFKTNYDLCEVNLDSFDDDSGLFDQDAPQQNEQQNAAAGSSISHSPQQPNERHSKARIPPFPLTLQQQQGNMNYYSRYTQDVHRCNSSLCLQCSSSNGSNNNGSARQPAGAGGSDNMVRFIPIRISSFSSDHNNVQPQSQPQEQDLYSWYDGSDVDFSMQSVDDQRSYLTPDTVQL